MSDLNELLRHAAASGASDLFVTAGKTPAFRKKGRIERENRPPVAAEDVDAFRISVIGTDGEALYQARAGFDASFSLSPDERFRINFFPSAAGPTFAARPLKPGGELTFERLKLPAAALSALCDMPRGMIFITGSTGSGKSSTLGAMINYINRNSCRHILTIEDPIEFLHEDAHSLITQREVSSETGAFAEALRNALRENPDVIVIGEMRDSETMRTALSAALTGHLVISTLHTTDTVQAAERILNLLPDGDREQAAQDIALAVNGIIAQRILPRAGTNGMLPAVELLPGTPTVKKLIAERDFNSLETLLKHSSDAGMVSFTRDFFRLYRAGRITLETARGALDNPDEFDLLVKGMETGSDTFRNYYGIGSDMDSIDMQRLFRATVKNGASDLILSSGASPVLRINGKLTALDLPQLSPPDIQRLLFSIIGKHQRVLLEEKRELDFSMAVRLSDLPGQSEDHPFRFRINAFYQRGSLGLVARSVATSVSSPEALSIPQVMVDLTEKQQGLILVTGPTGSGKSTTLASLIDHINRTRAAHIITIEDPIEFVHRNINSIVEQREVHSDTLGFATALKYVLRQDPDVILLGEMRDTETISAALTAAETGHLVFATIHTNSAPQTVDRIIDSFPAAQQNQIRLQLAGVVLGVISQRLLSKVDGSGRIPAFEIMVGTPPVRALIRENKTYQLPSVLETGMKDGMITMERALSDLYKQNLISWEEMSTYLP